MLTSAVFFGLKTSDVEKEIISSAWAHRNTKLKYSFCLAFEERNRLDRPDLYLPVQCWVALSLGSLPREG